MNALPSSFATFYDVEHPRVLRAVTLVLGDAPRAARITHESFVRTHATWRRSSEADAFVRTLRCAFRLAWRVRGDDPAESPLVVDLTDDSAEVRVLPLTDDAVGAEVPTVVDLREERIERDADLELALASLPRAPRCAVVFTFYLGLEPHALATVMSLPEAEVREHLDYGRAQLGAILGEDRTGVS